MVKKRLVGIILSALLTGTGWAATSSPSLMATPPQPMWSELTVPQKIVLAPLSDEWDSLEYYRQKKWLSIVARFSAMRPEEQHRIQGQMQTWRRLSPEERQLAREKFKTTSRLPTEKQQELKQKWAEYQSLPEEEKAKLKQAVASKPVPKPGRTAVAAPAAPLVPPLSAPGTAQLAIETNESGAPLATSERR